jgi:hypothetical protein
MSADVLLPLLQLWFFFVRSRCIGSGDIDIPAVRIGLMRYRFWRLKQRRHEELGQERASTSIAHPQVIRKVVVSVCPKTIFA